MIAVASEVFSTSISPQRVSIVVRIHLLEPVFAFDPCLVRVDLQTSTIEQDPVHHDLVQHIPIATVAIASETILIHLAHEVVQMP